MSYKQIAESLDEVVLLAIKSYTPDRPATRGDLWSMHALQNKCGQFGVCEPIGALERSIQRLKSAGQIKYQRKPAGWVVA